MRDHPTPGSQGHRSGPAPTHNTPTSAQAATPVGTWNVAYTSAPTTNLGQDSITEDGGFYYTTTKTDLYSPDGHCTLKPGIDEGTFSWLYGEKYSGTINLYQPGTCAFANTTASLTATLSSDGNTLTEQIANAEPPSLILTRAGSAPATAIPPAPSQAAPASGGTGNSSNSVGNGNNGAGLTRCGLNRTSRRPWCTRCLPARDQLSIRDERGECVHASRYRERAQLSHRADVRDGL